MIEVKPFRKRLIIIEPADGHGDGTKEHQQADCSSSKRPKREAETVIATAASLSAKPPGGTGVVPATLMKNIKDEKDCLHQVHDEYNEVDEDTDASSLSSASMCSPKKRPWVDTPTILESPGGATPVAVLLDLRGSDGRLYHVVPPKNTTKGRINRKGSSRVMRMFPSNPASSPLLPPPGRPLQAPPSLPRLQAGQSVKRPQTATI